MFTIELNGKVSLGKGEEGGIEEALSEMSE